MTLYHTDPLRTSCPLNLTSPCDRKSFTLLCDDRYLPFAASFIPHQEQLFISIYDDHHPSLVIQNLTDLQLHVAQATSVNPSKTPLPVSDCRGEEWLAWHQLVSAKQLIYYAPPIIDDTFPDIQTVEFAIIFACVGPGASSVRWSRPLRIDESKEIFLDIPMYGDIKVSVNTDGKATKVVLDYIRQDTEFSAKDIRARLVNPLMANSDEGDSLLGNLKPHEAGRITGSIIDGVVHDAVLGDALTRSCLDSITLHTHIDSFRVTLFTDCEKKRFQPHDVLLFNVEGVAARYSSQTGEVEATLDSFQVDNLLFNTGDYDFPVLVCPQIESTEDKENASVYELQSWFSANQSSAGFAYIKIELYPKEGGCKSLEVQLNPIKAFVEDTYISVLLEYLNDCFGTNTLHATETVPDKERCSDGEVLIPKLVLQQANLLAEPMRIKKIKIHSFNALISVHTCLR